MAESLPAEVRAWLDAPPQGELVKDNRVRSVHRWNGLFIKRFKYPGWVQQLRRIVNDRAAHEHRVLRTLHARGVPVPEPLAFARRGGSTYLFTREIPGARPLSTLPLDRPLLLRFAALLRAVIDAGLRDDDLHVGNVLASGDRLYLVDVHRSAFVGVLTPAEIARTVAFALLSFYTRVSQTDLLRFIRACGADPAEVWAAFQAERERYYLDRQARVRRTGSDFQVVDGLVLRRPTPEAEARALLEAPPTRVVKERPHRRLWLAGPGRFVKEGAPDLWYNAFGLETRGIPTPRLMAVKGDRTAGLWVEGALPLWEHLQAHGVSRDLLWRLARLVRRMHRRGVYHRDLKANNVLVRGGEIWVIDLDRVEFMREVPRDKCAWNLAQLNAAVGAPVTRTDRLRFYFAYAARDRAARVGWKSWVRDVMRLTRERRHVWPKQ